MHVFFYWRLWLGALVVALVASTAHAAGRDITPQDDAEIVETLPTRIAPRKAGAASEPGKPSTAAQVAKDWINLARREADPRYLGRAQSVLAPWWDSPDAPADIAVLQATVQQSRHEFDAARRTLQGALKRSPANPQGWLTMATLERLQGRYAVALQACEAVQRAGAAFYAAACALETRSLQGHSDEATQGFASLLAQSKAPSVRAWLLSLQAEHQERAGQDAWALQSYQSSLKLEADGYTALALADLLLRKSKAADALRVLANQPLSDAVLLRRAYALKQLGMSDWKPLHSDLQARFAASAARGDDPALHARELALAALWLAEDLATAAVYAQTNWQLQKEPLDWFIALKTAHASTTPNYLATLKIALAQAGLKDARLAYWAPHGAQPTKAAP